MKIAIATKNNGKLKEFEELAKGTPYEFIKIPENIKNKLQDTVDPEKLKRKLTETVDPEKL